MPDFLPAIIQKGKVLTQLSRLNEAAQLIEAAPGRFPSEGTLLTDLQALYTWIQVAGETSAVTTEHPFATNIHGGR